MLQLDAIRIASTTNSRQDLDDAKINVELEQGRASEGSRVQNNLLKQSAPLIHVSYNGQAARHMNAVGEDHILVVNSEHKVDVFKRG